MSMAADALQLDTVLLDATTRVPLMLSEPTGHPSGERLQEFVLILPNETLTPPPKLMAPVLEYATAEQSDIVFRDAVNTESCTIVYPTFPPTFPMKTERQPP
jgi:hypothetical protein